MSEQAPQTESIDIDAILDSQYDFRRPYERIDHPDKELVLTTLASVATDPNQLPETPLAEWQQEHAERRLGNIVRYGTLYFGRSAYLLARTQARDAELARLQAEYDQLSWEERDERNLWRRPTEQTDIDADSLTMNTAALATRDIVEHMVAEQMHDAFNVAYQGPTRLPDFARYSSDRGSLDEIMASGIILAERLGGLTAEEFAKAATSRLYGDHGMVASAYGSLLRGMDCAREHTFKGEPIELVQDYGEMGYALFRSRSSAGRYVLGMANKLWPSEDASEIDEFDLDTAARQLFSEEDAVLMCSSAEGIATLVSRQKYFPPLNSDLFVRVVENIRPNESGQLFGSYEWSPKFADLVEDFRLDEIEDVTDTTRRFLAAGHNDVAWDFYSTYRKERLAGMEVFKSGIDEHSFLFTEAIMNGELTDEHAAIGITESGWAGVEQLREAIKGIEQFILAEDRTDDAMLSEIERIQSSPLYARLWRVAVRFNVAAYGSKDSNEIIRVLNDAIKQREDAEVPELDTDVYKVANNVSINERLTEHEGMNPDAEKLIDQFCEYARLAWSRDPEMVSALGGFEERVTEFRATLLDALKEIDTLIAEAGPDGSERRVMALAEQRQLIVEVLQASFENDLLTDGGFLEAYNKLHKVKMARGILREKALRDAKTEKWDEIEGVFGKLLKGDSVEDELASMLDLVDHILVQEYLLKLNPEDKEYKRFITKTLFNTSVIESALADLQNKSLLVEDPTLIPKRSLTILPSRDIGLELSGQIGDACWASKYGSIAKQMPNLTAVLFAENQEDGTKGLVGSSLFIEAETEGGEKLLIVRGLNPIQNFIGRVDSHDFLSKFMGYAKETADRAGRKLAVVYDHRGGASTNRPALFNAMTAYVSSNNLPTIEVPEDQVQFNGYTLKDSIYLVG
jgi:hypothetical protein